MRYIAYRRWLQLHNQQWKEYLAWAWLTASPFTLLIALSIIGSKNVFMGRPVWSDELSYWRQIYSFSTRGFAMGYSGWAGLEASIGPLYSHGLGPVVLYWPYAKLAGWNLNSIVICNTILMSLSFLVLVIALKPSMSRSLILASMYVFYIPIIEYSVTSMMEIPQYACLVMSLALLLRFSKTGHIFDFLLL